MQLLLALLTILSISGTAFARTDNETDCGRFLESAFTEGSTTERHQKIREHFSQSPRVIFEEPVSTEPSQGMEFYASNEFDWARRKADYSPADVVLGFATNNVWDEAVRRNAKIMVIGDIVAGPLMNQEYVLRPIFEMAQTRAEFLSMVEGLPIKGVDSSVPPAGVFKQTIDSMVKNQRGRDKFVEGILEKVFNNPKFGPAYAGIMRQYYMTVFTLMEANQNPGAHFLFQTPMSPVPFPGYRGRVAGDLLSYYAGRYNPERWIRDGGVIPIEASNPMYSFMASEEAYQRLRRMFVEDRVFFVRSDFKNQKIYETVAHIMHEKNLKTIAITTSNIADVIADDSTEANRIYEDFVYATSATLAREGIKGSVPFLQTRGCQPPHNFETHEVKLGCPTEALHFTPWEGESDFLATILRRFADNF